MRTLFLLLAVLFAFTSYGQNQRVQSLQASAGITTAVLRATSDVNITAATASRVMILNANKSLTNSAVTDTELALLSGLTGAPPPASRTITVAGTAGQISSSAGAQDLSVNRTWTLSFPSVMDIGGLTSFEIPNAAAPTVGTFGEIAGDNNLWAASRGAPIFYDGTAPVALIGALVSDTPTAGQRPQWNANGTITWEDAGSVTLSGLTTAITATPTNLTGDIPLLLMSGHPVATFTPTNTAMIGVVSPGGTNWVWPPKLISIVVTGATPGLVHALSFSNAVAINTLALNPGTTNWFGIFYDGITNRAYSWQDLRTGDGKYVMDSAPSITNAVFLSSINLPNGAAVTTDAFGEVGGDNNIWASGRGALQAFDGTANTLLVGVLASDTPSNLQVPKFNTASGTITWENDDNSGAATALNDIADPTADGIVATAGFRMAYTTTLDGGVLNTITNSDADLATATWLLEGVYLDNGDADAGFYKWTHNAGASIAESLTSTLKFIGVASSNASTVLVNGNAGFGGTVSAIGNISSSAAVIGSIDGATAGTTLKFKSYLYLKGPDLVQNGAMLPNTNDVTAVTFGKVLFSNSADQTANYAEWHIQVPDDVDIAVEPRAKIKFRLNGADTGTHRYVVSMVSVANSAAYAGTPGTAINLDFAGDASGASLDVETVGFTTLTGWGAAVTAGAHWIIRVARDGNDAADASTVDSMLSLLVLEYPVTQ